MKKPKKILKVGGSTDDLFRGSKFHFRSWCELLGHDGMDCPWSPAKDEFVTIESEMLENGSNFTDPTTCSDYHRITDLYFEQD